MLKVISLLKRKEDMSFEEFRKWALEEHPPLGKQLPGIRKYRMSVLLEDNPDLPCDAVSEFWFDDPIMYGSKLGEFFNLSIAWQS